MDDPPLQKIAISGPTLASLMERFASAPSAVDGLLFGHVTHLPLTLSDDSSSSSAPALLATVTGFLSSPSFYDSSGTVLPSSLRPHSSLLLGWFSGRRRSPLRPSMREFSVTSSLSSFSSEIQNPNSPNQPSLFPPCIFLLLASPPSDHAPSHVHTHEYRAFHFRPAAQRFHPTSLDVINIGPAFRAHYGAFAPNSPLPPLDCAALRSSPMTDAAAHDLRLSRMKRASKDQRELDHCARGFDVGRLGSMMGSEARSYTEGLEELYQEMLFKLVDLTALVERSSAKVLEQESHNRKLKHKILRSASE